MFNDSLKKFTLSFDSWTTGRRNVSTGKEYQVDFVSAQVINRPNFLLAAHQSEATVGGANKPNQKNLHFLVSLMLEKNCKN